MPTLRVTRLTAMYRSLSVPEDCSCAADFSSQAVASRGKLPGEPAVQQLARAHAALLAS